MPTARPIISARVGAVDDSVTRFDVSSRAPIPTPMPTIAVSRFIPAASSDPKVSTSTRTATTTPTNSVAPMVTPVEPKASPPTATSRPASFAASVVASRASRLLESSSSRSTPYRTDARAACPSGLTAELSNGLITAATCGAWPAAATTSAIAAAFAGSATDSPSGATKTICAPAPAAPSETSASWSSASCDSEPGMVNRSSNEPPTVISRVTTVPSRASHATETRPRWRNEARPSRARNELMGRGTPGSVGGGGTQQEEERGALQIGGGTVGGGPVAGGAAGRTAAEHLPDDDPVVQGQDDAGQPVRGQRQAKADAGCRGLDERGQPAVQPLGVPAQRSGRLRVPRGVQAVLGVHEHPGAVGAEGGEASLDGRRHRVVLVLEAGQLLLGAGEITGGLALEQGREELVLGAEAGVEGAAGEAPATADVLDAGRGEPDVGEGLEGRVEQPLHRVGAAPLGARLALVDHHDAELYWIRQCIRYISAS